MKDFLCGFVTTCVTIKNICILKQNMVLLIWRHMNTDKSKRRIFNRDNNKLSIMSLIVISISMCNFLSHLI